MRIKMWGVRGSIPTPGPSTVEFGGNTSCYEVRCGDTLVILDGGTGLRLLGQDLLRQMPFEAWMFFSHVHWDHIQGFPFFDPAFVKGNEIHLYGGNNVTRTLEETLAGQMDHPSFPVHLADMAAKMTFNDLAEGQSLEIDDGAGSKVKISTGRGNHPNGVWLYRVEHAGKAIVYATDTEHSKELDANVVKIASGADVLIYDSQYTPEEYEGKGGKGSKMGWGHSTFTAATEIAKAAKVKKLLLFHHDPLQSDDAVREKEKRAKAVFSDVIAAYEGLTLEV